MKKVLENFKQTAKAVDQKKDVSTPPGLALLAFATRLDLLLIAAGVGCAIVHGVGMPLLAIIFGRMTNVFLAAAENFGNSNSSSNSTDDSADEFFAQVSLFCVYYALIGLAMFVCSYIQIATIETAAERQVYRMRQAYLRAVLRQTVEWFDDQQTGHLAGRLNEFGFGGGIDIERVREGIGDKLSLFVQLASTFVMGYLVGLLYDWRLTLVMLSLSPVLIASSAWMAKMMSTRTKAEQKRYAVAGGVAQEALSCIKTITSLNAQGIVKQKYFAALEEVRKSGIKKYFAMGLGMGINQCVQYTSYGLAFWFGSTLLTSDGSYSAGTIFTVFLAVMNGSFALGNALPHLNTIATAQGAVKNIVQIVRQIPDIDVFDDQGAQPADLKTDIRFEQVRFAYPKRADMTVLPSFSLSVEAGKHVAVVGASGCGKSTLMALLLRFYDVQDGQVLIGGHDVRSLNVRYLRRLFGVVGQEPVLFDGTVDDNIRLGNAAATDGDVEQALRSANASQFVGQLPQGVQTRVGERGAQLSGGQKQRIALARALLARPHILLLDEATSALDTESEALVQKALVQAAEGRTTITIAHRLSTVKHADQIVVLKDGHIVEQGTYAELLLAKGVFFDMVEAQQMEKQVQPVGEDETKPDKVLVKQRSTVSQLSATSSVQPATIDDSIEKISISKLWVYNRQIWALFAVSLVFNAGWGLIMPIFALLYTQIFEVYSLEAAALRNAAIFWGCMFAALGLFTMALNMGACMTLGRVSENVVARMRGDSFASLLRVHMAYYDDPSHTTGAICARFATDGPTCRYAFSRFPMVITSFFTVFAGVVISFVFGWRMALLMCALLPLIVGSGAVEWYFEFQRQRKTGEALTASGKLVSDTLGNIRTVKALGCELIFTDKYQHISEPGYRSNRSRAHRYAASFGFSQAMPFFMYSAGFAYGGYLISLQLMEPINVFRSFFGIAFCAISFGQIVSLLPDIIKSRISAAHMFRMIETPSFIDPLNKDGSVKELTGAIRFRGVHFSYPMRPSAKVLCDVSLSVEAGQTVALVGPSGCGKSTIISLIERFYDPTKGTIVGRGYFLLDDEPLADYNVAHVRRSMALVSQEPILFDCSIKQNIVYGLQQDGDVPHDHVVAAATQANIHDFIVGLPQGYDTPVGEKGTQLSGGQKQRLAIARALIRRPSLLLLDEATSALDTDSEKVVQEAIERARQGRTCIIVAHRLSTVMKADVIFVLKDGRVKETGTHSQLLAQQGLYHSLCQNQLLTSDS